MKTLAWVCLSWASLRRQLLSSLPWGRAYSKAAQGRRSSFPCHENTTSLKCITMLLSGKFRPDLPPAQEAFMQPSPSHLHELCHTNTHRVMDKSWGDLYLLAPMWCHGENMYRTVYGGLWVTKHLLVHRNCLFVCLRGPQHAVNKSSYPSQSSFSPHWAGDSATSCFIILDAFQKK